MMPKKILYTDGHEVTVTDSSLQVKKSVYMLNGITRHGFQVIQADRLPAYLTLLLGAMVFTLGVLRLVPQKTFDWNFMNIQWDSNILAISGGLLLIVIGAVIMGLMRDRYAVRIATAEGEKNVLVSTSKEYIEQILDAMNRAFLNLVAPLRNTRTLGRARS